jgi:hypothetical protein
MVGISCTCPAGDGQQHAIFEIAERGQAGRSALLPLRGRRLLVQEGEQWQVCCGERAHRRVGIARRLRAVA